MGSAHASESVRGVAAAGGTPAQHSSLFNAAATYLAALRRGRARAGPRSRGAARLGTDAVEGQRPPRDARIGAEAHTRVACTECTPPHD